MKPIEGAETGGAVGFFKGVGKGLVGYVLTSGDPGHKRNLQSIFKQCRHEARGWCLRSCFKRQRRYAVTLNNVTAFTPPTVGIRNTTTVFDAPDRERVRPVRCRPASGCVDPDIFRSLVIHQRMGY